MDEKERKDIERTMASIHYTKLANDKYVSELRGEKYLTTVFRLLKEKGITVQALSRYFGITLKEARNLVNGGKAE